MTDIDLHFEIKGASAEELSEGLREVASKLGEPLKAQREDFHFTVRKFMGKRGLAHRYAELVEASPVSYETAQPIVSTMGKLGVIYEHELLKFALYEVSGGKKSVNEVKNWIESLVGLTRFYNGKSAFNIVRQIVPATAKKVEETSPEELGQL